MDEGTRETGREPGSGEFRPPGASRASRRPSLRSRGSHRGHLIGGPNPTRILYESKLESDAAYVLLARADVTDLQEQPPAVWYRDAAGRQRSHTFDFLATMSDGRRIAIAIRPQEKAQRKQLEALLRVIAPQLPRTFATDLAIITERHLPRDLVRDTRLIHSVRREPRGQDDDAIMAIMAGVRGGVTIGALVEASGLAGLGFRAIVRRIAADGDLRISGPRPISHATTVSTARSDDTPWHDPSGRLSPGAPDRGASDQGR